MSEIRGDTQEVTADDAHFVEDYRSEELPRDDGAVTDNGAGKYSEKASAALTNSLAGAHFSSGECSSVTWRSAGSVARSSKARASQLTRRMRQESLPDFAKPRIEKGYIAPYVLGGEMPASTRPWKQDTITRREQPLSLGEIVERSWVAVTGYADAPVIPEKPTPCCAWLEGLYCGFFFQFHPAPPKDEPGFGPSHAVCCDKRIPAKIRKK